MRKRRMKVKPKLINENLLMKDNSATDMLNKRHFYIICIFLVVATLAVYWQILDSDFVYDDEEYISEHTQNNTEK